MDIILIAMCYITTFADAKTFYLLEDWALDNELSEYTNLLRHFYEYHKYCSRSAYKIASLSAVTDNQVSSASYSTCHQPISYIDTWQRHEITVEYLKIIRDTFLESLYSFLDGLVHLAFSDYTPLQGEEEELNLTRKRGNIDVHSMVRKERLHNCICSSFTHGANPRYLRMSVYC
jgi:exocyst complex component 2